MLNRPVTIVAPLWLVLAACVMLIALLAMLFVVINRSSPDVWTITLWTKYGEDGKPLEQRLMRLNKTTGDVDSWWPKEQQWIQLNRAPSVRASEDAANAQR
jgi:hypothetical protein